MKTISVFELQQILNNKESIQLLDVRNHDELAIAQIQPNIHIPLHLLPLKHHRLDKKVPTAILCHHGNRSAFACQFLNKMGFDVYNVEGGIEAWSVHIDSSVRRY